jgi:hypothetical protein
MAGQLAGAIRAFWDPHSATPALRSGGHAMFEARPQNGIPLDLRVRIQRTKPRPLCEAREKESDNMAWDFETEPEFQRELNWMDAFVREEVESRGLLFENPYDKSDADAMSVMKPLQEQVKERGVGKRRPLFATTGKSSSDE